VEDAAGDHPGLTFFGTLLAFVKSLPTIHSSPSMARLLKSYLTAVCFSVVALSCASADVKAWSSPQDGFAISYDAAVWTPLTPEQLASQPVSFALVNKDQKTTVFIQVFPLKAGEKFGQKSLDTFSKNFAKNAAQAGEKDTVQWTRTDFKPTGECEFTIMYEHPKPGNFMSGRICSHNGKIIEVIATGRGSSDEARSSAMDVVRSIVRN